MARESDALHLPGTVDVDSPSWTSDVCPVLRSWGFARLRLSQSEAALVQELYDSMDAVFRDERSGTQLEISEREKTGLTNAAVTYLASTVTCLSFILGARQLAGLAEQAQLPQSVLYAVQRTSLR
eukprot:CAMPEP_0172697090 /NCGR_PEP_ID=MMETSP1074-20121228/28509_1 /TAXON_ID=2916 /ORGANISM="Ceratium fusus, Strain PA161109" /LENGTH=124 /DNA_ID=CAMNT_0013517935 /DNA_START=37 /DNA_END=409 /DNA_ORIENTATION=+